MQNQNEGVLMQDQIRILCQRALGEEASPISITALHGGTFNEVYSVKLSGQNQVILRIAPPETAEIYWDDQFLMRREKNIYPFFASISEYLPEIIFTDFSHKIIDRDYMFQTYVNGVRWEEVEDDLKTGETIALWQQFGEIVKKLHATSGESFGHPLPAYQYEIWSEAVLQRCEKLHQSLQEYQIDRRDFVKITRIAQEKAFHLDEIQTPRLLHGDLWTFNLLIDRNLEVPRIVGVIDIDRAWWGDPMADWSMFLLEVRREEQGWKSRIKAFEDGYGVIETGAEQIFRKEIYKAMHIADAAVWSARNEDMNGIWRAKAELAIISEKIQGL